MLAPAAAVGVDGVTRVELDGAGEVLTERRRALHEDVGVEAEPAAR
jgi:hypothetical protein